MRATVACLLLVVLGGCPSKPAGDGGKFENWYPDDISLPPGIQYPCELTPLPTILTGVPVDERRYVNHSCALMIGLIKEKEVLMDAIVNGRSLGEKHASYATKNGEVIGKLKAEPVPSGLEGFHADLIRSLELQAAFFDEAVRQLGGGASVDQVQQIPSGRESSGKLITCWGAWQARYPQLAPEVKDSMYHHLCALDLF